MPKSHPQELVVGAESHHSAHVQVKYLAENEIAKRLLQDGRTFYVGNEAILPLIGRKCNFGHTNENRWKTEIQEYIQEYIPMLNFKFFSGEAQELRTQVEGWKHIVEQKPGYIKKSREDAE